MRRYICTIDIVLQAYIFSPPTKNSHVATVPITILRYQTEKWWIHIQSPCTTAMRFTGKGFRWTRTIKDVTLIIKGCEW